jgi:hypothetical protein
MEIQPHILQAHFPADVARSAAPFADINEQEWIEMKDEFFYDMATAVAAIPGVSPGSAIGKGYYRLHKRPSISDCSSAINLFASSTLLPSRKKYSLSAAG